jgi:integrase
MTPVKRHAEALLEKYVQGKLRLDQGVTVGEFYEQWIKQKEKDSTLRKSLFVSYKQHYSGYLCSEFASTLLATIRNTHLFEFRNKLLNQRLSVKTCRNIIDGTFRALWKDARRAGVVESNPFELLDWPAYHGARPDPYTVDERDALIRWVMEHEPYYYPWVRFQFETGCRPSESAALRWSDIDTINRIISINKSRNMGHEAAPKTKGSYRRITVSAELLEALSDLRIPGHDRETDHIFYNKISGKPLDAGQWARVYWARINAGAKVRQRKFYSTRHTSITEAIKAGANMLAAAQYHGTSVEMIERNYCGALQLDAPKMPQYFPASVVVPTGIEPAPAPLTDADKHALPRKLKKSA